MHKRVDTMATVSRGDREEELALFHEVRRRERDHKCNAVHPLPHGVDQPPHLGSTYTLMQHQLTSFGAKMASTQTRSKPVYDPLTEDLNKKSDDLLTSELGKNDYDWLLTPPGTPLINPLDHNSASNGDDFLSRVDPLSSIRSLAAIKTSRFSSSKTEPSLKKEGAILSTKPDLALRKGPSRSNGLTGSSLYTTNNATAMATKKISLTPGSRYSSRPTSPTKRTTAVPSTYTSRPTTPTSRPKPTSAPTSRPTTPTTRTKPTTPTSHPSTPTSRPTTALASRSGSNSISSPSMISQKPGASSPGTAPIRLAAPQAQTQLLSTGISRSSSIIKGRPLPCRSAPSSRGSSPTAKSYEWHQGNPAFFLESQSIRTSLTLVPTTDSSLRGSLTTPSSMNLKGSPVGSSSRPGATASTTSTTHTTFSSSNQLGTSSDISRKACSPRTSLIRGMSSSLSISRDRHSSASLIMSKSSVQLDRSLGDIVARNTKVGPNILQATRRSLGSSLSPDTTWSALQTKHLLEKSASPASSRDHVTFNKHASPRSLDLTAQNSNLRQNASNGFSGTPLSSLFSARHGETYASSNNFSIASNSNASIDCSMIALRAQDGSEPGEEFLCGSDFKMPPPSRSEFLTSLVKDARVNNWLGSQEYMDEGLDLMQVFEQGTDKFERCESPLVCPHGGGAANCDLCNVKMRLQMLNEKSKASFGAISQIIGEA